MNIVRIDEYDRPFPKRIAHIIDSGSRLAGQHVMDLQRAVYMQQDIIPVTAVILKHTDWKMYRAAASILYNRFFIKIVFVGGMAVDRIIPVAICIPHILPHLSLIHI